jgi:hypothetical protein
MSSLVCTSRSTVSRIVQMLSRLHREPRGEHPRRRATDVRQTVTPTTTNFET